MTTWFAHTLTAKCMINRRTYMTALSIANSCRWTKLLRAARRGKRSATDESIYVRYWRFHYAAATQVNQLVQVTVTALIPALLATRHKHEIPAAAAALSACVTTYTVERERERESITGLSESFPTSSCLALQRWRHTVTSSRTGALRWAKPRDSLSHRWWRM